MVRINRVEGAEETELLDRFSRYDPRFRSGPRTQFEQERTAEHYRGVAEEARLAGLGEVVVHEAGVEETPAEPDQQESVA